MMAAYNQNAIAFVESASRQRKVAQTVAGCHDGFDIGFRRIDIVGAIKSKIG